jgi:hypothetical protein
VTLRQPGDFGSTFDKIDTDCYLAQILPYDGADERLMVGQSRDAEPSYYMVFVTAYNDGVIPERLQGRVTKRRALAQHVVISPDVLEKKMASLNADDMKRPLHDSGEVVVYGLYSTQTRTRLNPNRNRPWLNRETNEERACPPFAHCWAQGQPGEARL